MRDGTIRIIPKPGNPGHNIQRLADGEQNGGCGYVPGPCGGFMPAIVLQATWFRILVNAKTSLRTIVCEGYSYAESKYYIVFSRLRAQLP